MKILDATWVVGENLDLVGYLDPWHAFFSDPTISSKTANFNLLRCKLNVKVLINGSPMHYGRAVMSYLPWHFEDTISQAEYGTDRDANMMHFSQRPHIYIDPTTSQGGCLCLPFMHLENWIRPWKENSLREMGSLSFYSFDVLRSTVVDLSLDTNISITVFAWASEVELAGPTMRKFVAQSDEYDDDGPISKPASAIAKAAGALTDLPVIGIFARATQLAANSVSKIASLFGFSRPVIITNPSFMKNTIMGNMANTNVPEAASKLSLDAKQELTIDPRTVGLGGIDEMSIKYLVEKESYIDQFLWQMSATPGAPLYSVSVHPAQYRNDAGISNAYITTPMAYVSNLFEHWSGTIIYRFQIVASAFHRGRIRVTWDPASHAVGGSVNDATIVSNYCRIIDISEERDFEVAVNWGQETPYRIVPHMEEYTENAIPIRAYGATEVLLVEDSMNGVLAVHVINELAGPDSGNDIKVNVFVRAGDDFELGNPTSNRIRQVGFFEPQGLEYSACYPSQLPYTFQSAEFGLETEGEANAPEGAVSVTEIGMPDSVTTMKNQVFFGESVVSIRQLLRRYNQHMIHSPPPYVSAGTDVLKWRLAQRPFPLYRGFDPNGIHASITHPYNYVNTTVLNYMTPCYIGRRGGIRFKQVVEGADNTWYLDAVRLVDDDPSSSGYESRIDEIMTKSNSVDAKARLFQNATREGASGRYATMTRNQPCAETEMPFYSQQRFAFARDLTKRHGNIRDGTDRVLLQNSVHGNFAANSGSDTATVYIDQFVSVGEDFALFFFIETPAIWYHNNPSAST